MLKSFFASTFVLFCTSLIESSLFADISILPAIPDLSLICVMYFALHNGRGLGESTGFVSGLFLDFLSAGPFGLNCLIRTVIGWAGGWFIKTLNTEAFFLQILYGLAVTMFKAVFLWFASLIFPFVFSYNFISVAFGFELLVNALLTPFIFRFLDVFEKTLVLDPEKVK